MPSKPGKPQLPAGSLIGCPDVSLTHGLPLVTAGSTYLAPYSAWKPSYPPGSSGSRSGLAFWLPLQIPPPAAQWIAMPTKSVWAFARVAGLLASFHSGEPTPKTRVMSPLGEVELFSSSMFAVPTPPKSHPARVYGTHGAGVVFCPSVIMFGS